ncbi:hypothetical protein [Sulfuricurvum sp.]|uniref:hypothetical protein n=1 Tax=Sulfuricurvum sp. TaxID=2025608 RepID=UPI003C45C5F4
MIPFYPLYRRLITLLQCFGKRRYGYLDRSLCAIPEGKEALYLILSPDLYRITIVTLPVATTQEALRYAPAYFDAGDAAIVFGAYRLDEGRYLLSACDPEPVRERLEESGVNPSSVVRFVLAQEAFGVDVLPIALSDGSALALSEGVVVRLPSQYVSTPVQHKLEEVLTNLLPCLSGFKANMHKGGTATKKTLIMSAVLSGLIAFNFIVQGVLSYREGERIREEQEQMQALKHLPTTQMELDALADTWEKKEREQIKLRKIIAVFGTLPLESNATVSLPPPSVPAQNGIVLVPGSNPSEQNLLLIPGDSNATTGTIGTSGGEYVASLGYENRVITFKILTPSEDRAEKVRDIASRILKTNTVTIKETSVEGSIQ